MFLQFFIGTTLAFILEIVLDFYYDKFYLPKKCKYNCSKCDNWRCYKNYCDKKREEFNR